MKRCWFHAVVAVRLYIGTPVRPGPTDPAEHEALASACRAKGMHLRFATASAPPGREFDHFEVLGVSRTPASSEVQWEELVRTSRVMA